MAYDIFLERGKWYFTDEYDIITYGPFKTAQEARDYYDEYYKVIDKYARKLIEA